MAVDFGRYQLLRKIASGGMGQVFLARTAGQAGFEKLVVIKRILPQLTEDQEFIEMFFDEARIAARLNHPNLVQLFDLSEVDGAHYLAMEYVPGEDLRRVEKKSHAAGAPLPLPLILRIIADAAAGLDYAHKAKDAQGQPLNLVHRDVSPQNILVGFDGAVKLIDFGVAKAAGRMQHTASGILKGKYPYMSPEQADGREIDGRSDQFALGIILWELLTKRRLFKADSDLQTLRLVKECEVPRPSRFNAEVSGALDGLVLKALAQDKDARFADSGELRLALENFLIGNAMAGSSAHLAAFMQRLYAERIAAESDPRLLDQLASLDAGFIPAPAPSPSSQSLERWTPGDPQASTQQKTVSSRRHAPADAPPPDAPGERHGGTRSLSAPGRRGVPVKWLALSATALILLALGVALPLLSKKDAPPPEALPVAFTPSVKVLDPSTLPPPAETVEFDSMVVLLALSSTPDGAEVLLDGERLGKTPYTLAVPTDGSRLRVTLELAGYERVSQEVSRADAPALSVALRKKVARGTGKKAPPPPLGIKTGR